MLESKVAVATAAVMGIIQRIAHNFAQAAGKLADTRIFVVYRRSDRISNGQ